MNQITDPSDWPEEFKPLKDIDSHLRCPICKELLRAAMTLQCHHNFCSECIRRHLDKESTCPACRVSTSTAHMRRNVALDEIANSFGDCRSLLLKTVMDSVAKKKASSAGLYREESMETDDIGNPQKRRRMSARMTSKASQHSTTDIHDDSVPVDDAVDGDEDFIMPSQDSAPVYKSKYATRSSAGPALRTRVGRSDNAAPVPELTPSRNSPTLAPLPEPISAPVKHRLVACPVCEMGVPESYANTHLDKFCFAGKKDPAYNIPFELIIKQKETVIWTYERQGTSTNVVVPQHSSAQSAQNNGTTAFRMMQQSSAQATPKPTYPEPKRLPKLTYSVMNDKALRKKLQELGLNSYGDKQLMQKRHAEYVTIFNANCDATRPQTTAQLLKAMDVWERTYELDLQAKDAQRRVQEQQQRQQQQELARRQQIATATTTDSVSATSPTPSPTSSSSNFIPNQANNNEMAVAAASASAFAHALKYADEYAELIESVRQRERIAAEKKLTETQKAKKDSILL